MMNEGYEPGSFRDRNSRVFYRDGAVLRCLSEKALKDWEALSSTRFFPQLMAEKKLIHTERVENAGALPPALRGTWAGLLKHEALPFVSYPYEWCFGQLKDAALLQLELLLAALEEGMILQDASAFNIQWKGAKPVFIDIPSFKRLEQGEPWIGYRQFCQMFLYPLLLQVYRGIPFQPWLRGSIDGIESEHCYRLMSLLDLLKPGVFSHVYLQTKMQARYAATQREVKADIQAAGFGKEMIVANARRLRGLIQGLAWQPTDSMWTGYMANQPYTESDQRQKIDFVRQTVKSKSWKLVWDLGCNTGLYSRVAAENARYVIAMDADHMVIDHLYQELKSEGRASILPLINNIADPSPNLGWRGLERKAMMARGRPELVLCLALIHHIVIAANIPLKEVIRWLGDLGGSLVIEFITKDDPQVRQLLRNKEDTYADYEVATFEEGLSEVFSIKRREVLSVGTRILYFAQL